MAARERWFEISVTLAGQRPMHQLIKGTSASAARKAAAERYGNAAVALVPQEHQRLLRGRNSQTGDK